MKHLLTLFIMLLCFALPAQASRNILVIVIDDMRVDPQALTPNLDSFAQTATVYNEAYTSVPVCMGSRVTMMTGLKPPTHQVIDAFDFADYLNIYSTPTITTLPEVLSAGGYTTATMGKVMHGQQATRWDVAQPYNSITAFPRYNFGSPGPDGTFIHKLVLQPQEVHPDQEVATWATQYIQNYTAPEPFFLAIGFEQPHLPWILPQSYYDMYPAPTFAVPPVGDLDDEPLEAQGNQLLYDLVVAANKEMEYTGAYLAAISHTDAMIGQVLNALDTSIYSGNTDVVIVSDHGLHLGEKYHWGKQTFWEQSTKVPFMIRSVNIPAGGVNSLVSLLDFAPTIVALAGLAPEPQFEGVSLTTGASPVEIYYEKGRARINTAGGLKTIDYDLTNQVGNQDKAQYHLGTDPNEYTNFLFGC